MTKIDHVPPQQLKPWPGNARRHSRKQVRQLIASIRRFGFTSPVIIDENNNILAGHGRVQAARELGLAEVPCRRLDHLSDTEKRAFVIADNKLALNSSWDRKLLARELSHFQTQEIDLDVGMIGFSTAEAKRLCETTVAKEGPDPAEDEKFECPEEETYGESGVTQRCAPGDVWQLGPHRLVCGDRLHGAAFEGWPAGCVEQMIVLEAPEDPHAADVPHAKSEWTAAAFFAADTARKRVLFAEPDLAKCGRILARWEAHAKAPALRLSRAANHAHEQPGVSQ